MLGVDARNGLAGATDFLKVPSEGIVDRGGSFGFKSSDGVKEIRELLEGWGLGACPRLAALDGAVVMRTTGGSGSKRGSSSKSILSTTRSLGGNGRIGVGERSSRCSVGAWDCILLALRIAPSLAASNAGSGFREGDLEAARRAAICSGGGDRVGTGDRPRFDVFAGESWLAFSLPTNSFTEWTSGSDSDSTVGRLAFALRFIELATAAAAAADRWGFTGGALRGGWLKAMVAPRKAESSRDAEANRWVAAISPFMEPIDWIWPGCLMNVRFRG